VPSDRSLAAAIRTSARGHEAGVKGEGHPAPALALELRDGAVRRFDDVSARSDASAAVEDLVSVINDRHRCG